MTEEDIQDVINRFVFTQKLPESQDLMAFSCTLLMAIFYLNFYLLISIKEPMLGADPWKTELESIWKLSKNAERKWE